jgi:hypothetical protein
MPEQTITAIEDLQARGFGTAEFLVDQDGNLIHVETAFTAQLQKGESLADFLARAKVEGIWQPGDRIQVPAQNKRTEYVRIIRPAKS